MPLYDYRCEACGHELEIQQKLSEAPLKKCPACKKSKLEKVISATVFRLKGGGWGKDLYSSVRPRSSNEDGDQKIERHLKASNEAEKKAKAKTEPKGS